MHQLASSDLDLWNFPFNVIRNNKNELGRGGTECIPRPHPARLPIFAAEVEVQKLLQQL
jgi:hypothetical protein